MTTYQKDKKFIARDVPAIPLDIVRTDGSYMYDRSGKKYLDFFTGWCVGNIGWGNPKVMNVIKKFNGPQYFSPMYANKLWADLAELLIKLAPQGLQKVYFTTGGTEAVEYALQAAMSQTHRHEFISIEGSYHGHSIGAMSIGDSGFRKHYKNLLSHCHKINPPLDEAAADKIEKILRTRKIAAYISEPIICNLGVVVPDQKYFKRVQAACKKYGAVLIIDEVATGFGRTGKIFASEHYHLKPDISCLAKGLTGGYSALGAVLMTQKIAKTMQWDFSFYSTFGGHPLNTAIALANMQYITKNKKRLLFNAKRLSIYFEKRLQKMAFQEPLDIRIKGLAIGLECTTASYASKIKARCRKNGLLVSGATSQSVIMFPALTMPLKVAKEGLDILQKSI